MLKVTGYSYFKKCGEGKLAENLFAPSCDFFLSEKTREVLQLADTHVLPVIESIQDQSMSIGCVRKMGHLFGFLRHYLLNMVLKFRVFISSLYVLFNNFGSKFLCLQATTI